MPGQRHGQVRIHTLILIGFRRGIDFDHGLRPAQSSCHIRGRQPQTIDAVRQGRRIDLRE